MMAMGVMNLGKYGDHYLKLAKIYTRIIGLIDEFLPDELAIEAPFYGKNVQSMLKLGRAQGVAIAAAISRDIPIAEYAPLKIKMSITGNGRAAKEQVAFMLQKILHIPDEEMLPQLDASDGLAAALCHFYQSNVSTGENKYRDWKDFASKNQDKVRK
jgi:crossover junction endodeoxyribonuclease RuvC